MKSRANIAALMLVSGIGFFSCASTPSPASGAVQGIIFDLGKAPLADATATLTAEALSYSAQSDTRGRFTIYGVPSGRYSLRIEKACYEPREWDIEIGNDCDVIYVQVSSYWQLLDAAATAIGNREWGKADDFIVRASGIQAQTVTELFLTAVLSDKRGNIGAAMTSIEKALAIDNASAYLWLYLADLHQKNQSDQQKTVDALRRYLELKNDPTVEARLNMLEEEGSTTK